MAEAHSAVAFSFTVSSDGVDVNLNYEALYAVWESGVMSWKKRMGKLKNNFHSGVFPSSPLSLLFTLSMVLALYLADWDVSVSVIHALQIRMPLPGCCPSLFGLLMSAAVCSLLIWLLGINLVRLLLKTLLSYHGWIYEQHGKPSLCTKMWLVCVRVLGGRNPMLNSYQGSLPKLPVPGLTDTLARYLKSVHPLMNEESYKRMEQLTKQFETGLGPKFQRYLILKSWWAVNYVSDWWEECVYLRGRSPIMINSNYYGIDAVLVKPTSRQISRAANMVCTLLRYRRVLNKEQLDPIVINRVVPLCSAQYERQFNTTRVPGIEKDTLVHYKDSGHIVVYHQGRYFIIYIRWKRRLLDAVEIEAQLQQILDDESQPSPGEEHLAALTAVDRIPWAKARKEFFSKGKNKASLDSIEKAAFLLILDDGDIDYDQEDPNSLDWFGRCMLHGNGHNRWFDKSFNLVVSANGRIGFNAEHSWADAPIMAYMWEYSLSDEYLLLGEKYTEDGRCCGTLTHQPHRPVHLQWDFPRPCLDLISLSSIQASQRCDDVDLHVMMFNEYGKGLIKTFNVSPDAFIQLSLQLAYFRDTGNFCLTYESSMTRLFREGRTETVRSCTEDTCAFVTAFQSGRCEREELIRLLRCATQTHQMLYRDAMTGSGVDRHLFCLYVVSKYTAQDSPFLNEVLSEPWRLSTSQTPHNQTTKMDLAMHPDKICGGGGFGPVADDGYGVSYMVAGEWTIFFHISCKASCPTTNSHKFGQRLWDSFHDMKMILQESPDSNHCSSG